ncbi:hypothetical protein BDV41DRAFT_543554 [Aspergillus transmontanensis]|uniref:Zn(2)-C6 fungal-type domain-containing protein n=1 Tax=Aspergillus transmontanensis TaxID=1034304 RepID=A0A5N6VQT4_9EURO|nr:hypothetical protein BDV41DRAFT_543554 [Aspergillus transmontanensis]
MRATNERYIHPHYILLGFTTASDQIKCDRVGSQCNWCLHHDMNCTYSSDLRSKRRRQDSRYK